MITDPADRIGFLMWQTAHAFGLRMAQELGELDLTAAQFGVLVHVTREPGVSAAELARRLNLTRQGIRAALQPLLDRGALVRKPHPVHRRVQGLFTTPEGEELARNADTRINATEGAMLDAFDPDDRTRFHGYIRRATEALNPAALDRTSIRPR